MNRLLIVLFGLMLAGCATPEPRGEPYGSGATLEEWNNAKRSGNISGSFSNHCSSASEIDAKDILLAVFFLPQSLIERVRLNLPIGQLDMAQDENKLVVRALNKSGTPILTHVLVRDGDYTQHAEEIVISTEADYGDEWSSIHYKRVDHIAKTPTGDLMIRMDSASTRPGIFGPITVAHTFFLIFRHVPGK